MTGASVSGSGTNTITVQPTSRLPGAVQVYVTIDPDAFSDAKGGGVTGFLKKDAWSFAASDIASISNVVAGSSDGVYQVGQSVSILVEFSEPVTVTGTPQLTLETGTTDRVATYASGSNSNELVFTYTVQDGDTNWDLDYASSSALDLNGGTITDSAGNVATISLPEPGSTGSLGANRNLVILTTLGNNPGDFDADLKVGFSDFLVFVGAFGSTTGEVAYRSDVDFDGDGSVNFSDFLSFVGLFGAEYQG